MKEIEYFRWWVTVPRRKRPYLTDFLMNAEEAARHYPGARPEPATRELRVVADSGIRARRRPRGRGGATPPGKEFALGAWRIGPLR
jgi:hypothetical protein